MNELPFDRSLVYPERNAVKRRRKTAERVIDARVEIATDGLQRRFREVVEALLAKGGPYGGRGGVTRLAKDMGVKQPAVSAWRRGGGAAPETIHRLAALANLDPLTLKATRDSGRFPQLDTCVAYHGPNRWLEATVAAARAGLWSDDVSSPEWMRRLDELDAVLAAISRRES